MAGRGFGNMVHPNAVVARRELERQALGSGAKGSGPKVIFLDLDGVLNRTRAATHIRLDEDLLRLLRDLIHRGGEDVHIVLSTYWRRFTDYITYVLSRYGISEGRVLGRTPGQGHLAGSCADDKVYESRSEEICHWLQEHPEVSGYVILDDRDTAGQGMLKPHFVHCRSDLGLTPEDVEKALEILQMPRLDLVDLGAAASPTPRRGQDLPAGPQQSGAAAELCQPGPARERPPKLVSYIAMQPRGHYPITDMMMIRNDIVKEVDYLASRAPVAIPGLAKIKRLAARAVLDQTWHARHGLKHFSGKARRRAAAGSLRGLHLLPAGRRGRRRVLDASAGLVRAAEEAKSQVMSELFLGAYPETANAAGAFGGVCLALPSASLMGLGLAGFRFCDDAWRYWRGDLSPASFLRECLASAASAGGGALGASLLTPVNPVAGFVGGLLASVAAAEGGRTAFEAMRRRPPSLLKCDGLTLSTRIAEVKLATLASRLPKQTLKATSLRPINYGLCRASPEAADLEISRMQNPPAWPPRREEEGDPYRLPRPGDRVALRGSRRRPELAGAPAQILTGADQEGFVTVRVFANPGDAGSLKQVHIEKLRPLDPPRAPTAPSQKDPSAAEAHSVSSASRGSRRSQGSGASSRRLGSSLSASGLAALRSAEAGRPRSRPPSAPAPSRRPPAPVASTHAEAGGNGSECGPRLAPDEIQSQLMKQKLSPYEASVAYASVASRSQNPLVNGRAQSAPSKIPVTYLTSPQRRLEDAYNHLPSVSEDPEEREALMEDEMILWFRVPMDGESDVLPNAFLGWKVASLASQRSRGPRPSRLHWAKACAAHEVREKSLKRCERLAGSRHQLWPWLRSWRAVAAQRPFAPSQQSPVDAGVPVSASAAGSILCRWVERSKCLSLSVAWLSWLSCMADLRRDKELRTAEEAVEKLFASCQERIASEVSRRRAVKDAALRFMASGSNENAPVVRALRAWHELVPRMKLERCEEQRRQLSQRAQKLSSAELRLLQRRNVALSRTRLRLCFVAWRLAALSRQLPALRRQAERRKVLESEATRTDRRMGYLETALSRLVQGGLAAAGAESLGLPRPPQ
eukprot:s802_g12.t5